MSTISFYAGRLGAVEISAQFGFFCLQPNRLDVIVTITTAHREIVVVGSDMASLDRRLRRMGFTVPQINRFNLWFVMEREGSTAYRVVRARRLLGLTLLMEGAATRTHTDAHPESLA